MAKIITETLFLIQLVVFQGQQRQHANKVLMKLFQGLKVLGIEEANKEQSVEDNARDGRHKLLMLILRH